MPIRPWTLDRVVLPQDVGGAPPRQTPGTWLNVTPAGINLTEASFGNDNFGVQDVLADPVRPNILYAFICYQGMWRSTDWGRRWSKVSKDGGPLDGGKNWCAEIASDASYMVCGCGNNSSGSPQVNNTVLKSVDGGYNWTQHASPLGGVSEEPYSISIDPTDNNHLVCSSHGSGSMYESTDRGGTWSSGIATGAGAGFFVHFLDNGSTVLCVPQDTGVARRGTKSGTWSFADNDTNPHPHGVMQIYSDRVNNFHFWPGNAGVLKSINNGASWTSVFSPDDMAVCVGTPSFIYAAYGFATGTTNDPNVKFAPASAGTSWSNHGAGTEPNYGAKRFAVTYDGTNRIIVGGMWDGGLWRYVE